MKVRIIGILIFTILMFNCITFAEIVDINKKEEDPPIWKVGDSWTYTIHKLVVNKIEDDHKIYLNGSIDDFVCTVVETNGSIYKVDFNGKINGFYECYIKPKKIPFYAKGNLKNSTSTFNGSIFFNKENLEIVDISAQIKGRTYVKIYPLPIYLNLPFKVVIENFLSRKIPILEFPLEVGNYWNFPKMKTITYLNASGPFGLIKIPVKVSKIYPFIPSAFHCSSKKIITVEAGTFNTYQISVGFFGISKNKYYYSPDIGNIVKMDIDTNATTIIMELKDTNRL